MDGWSELVMSVFTLCPFLTFAASPNLHLTELPYLDAEQ